MTKIGKTSFCRFAVLVLIMSLWVFGAGAADIKVRAFADRNEMGLGDTIVMTIQVTASESVHVQEPDLPPLENFNVMNSWTSSSSASRLMQGPRGMEFQIQRTFDFNYMLAPKKQGALTVPSFQVVVEGKVYRTQSFTIRVMGAGSGANQVPAQPGFPGGLDDLDEAERMFNQLLQRQAQQGLPRGQVVPKNPNESFFIHVDIDKDSVYEGEQITANWFLYTRGNILALDRLKFPDLRGFWKEIIEEVPALNFTQEVLNGMSYRRALLASHALFPIKPGKAYIDEYKVKATVQVPTSQFGSFGFGQPYSFTRSSDRKEITVKPLPVEGKPQDFTGAVGIFDVQALVDTQEVPLNQPFALKIRFEGEGNAKLIELPALGLPTGLENFDTKSDAKFFKNGRSFKQFDVLLIPREPGALEIPSLSVSLFNPRTGQYYTKRTQPIRLQVTGTKSDEPVVAASGTSTKPQARKDSRPQMPVLVLEAQIGPSATPWGFAAGVALLSIVAQMAYLWGRLRAGKKESLQRLMKARMKKIRASQKLGRWREASTQMNNLISLVLGEISGEGGASREFKILIEKAPPSLRQQHGEALRAAVDYFQLLSFAPEEALGDLKSSQKTDEMIARTESLLKMALEHLNSSEKKSSSPEL